MQRYLWVLFPALLGGCGLPPALVIASYAADGASYITTGKSVSDHGISAATGRDCALLRMVEGKSMCRDEPSERADPAPVEVGQQATVPPDGSPAKSAGDRHRYLVLGSFADVRNAERLARDRRDEPITVVKTSIGGRVTHRVVAGPLTDHEVAELRHRLSREEQPRAWEIASLPPGA